MCQELNDDVMPWKQCKGYPSDNLKPRELVVQGIHYLPGERVVSCGWTSWFTGPLVKVQVALLLLYIWASLMPSSLALEKIASLFLKTSLIWTLSFCHKDFPSPQSKQYLSFTGYIVKASLIASDHYQGYLEYCKNLIYVLWEMGALTCKKLNVLGWPKYKVWIAFGWERNRKTHFQ